MATDEQEVGAEIRDCERLCPKCGQWKHHSRFRSRRRTTSIHVGIEFNSLCKDCEQIERNERKNKDRPLALMKQRAATKASNLGVPSKFVWMNMNWRALVPYARAMMTEDGRCLSCGHPFLNERDIQIEHREPPRFTGDWAREHARNLALFCHSCNNTKGRKPYAQWLDEQEEARLANEAHRASSPFQIPASVSVQLTWDDL
jgi:hypothetical protein